MTLEATLAADTLPTRFEALTFVNPEPFPVIRLVTIEFRFEIPETLRLVKIPTDVMLGWEGFVTLEATLAAATFPTRFEEFRFEIAEPLETTSNPATVRPVKVPTEVMLGWAGFVTLEATLAASTFPTKFEELRLLRPDALPMYRLAKTEFRFEIPKTFRVADPKTVAEFTYKVETLRTSVILAEPRTYRFDPTGGALKVPMDTPFWYATFPSTVVHCDERMPMFDAAVTRPYWSTVTWDTFALEPYVPATTPLGGKFVFEIVPVMFEALRFERPYPFPK